MKLVGIEFHGFKSFADAADIRFHDGITAIVGPNGCGKSNISDGLRWVLGEQRPTAIRGSRMEEAIFQGTKRRKPIHRAEVVLRLSNEDHLLPVPYSDVEISRTVHTGGESDYRLNGTLCRLRDIQDLCRDTGLGANAYAIIEGRMIDAILSDRAEERRAMFEEAAGISRYKERRRVAARRLDEADADLARVDDLVSEVQTKVRSLARQRGRARRYLEMRERKLALELAIAHADLTRLGERRREIEAELSGLSETRVKDAAQLRSAEAEQEALSTRLADLERARAEGARELMAVRDRLGERERQRLLAEERARHARTRLEGVVREQGELEEQRGALEDDVARLRTQVERKSASLAELREALRAREVELAEVGERRRAMEAAEAAVEAERQAYHERRARLQAGREAAQAEAAELARRIEDAEARLAVARTGVESVAQLEAEARREAEEAEAQMAEASRDSEAERSRLSELQSAHEAIRRRQVALGERLQAIVERIEALRPFASGAEGLSPAVQAALARRDELGVRGVLGEGLDVPDDFTEGVEAYLGAYLEALVVDDRSAVERIRRWFLEEYRGPGGLVVTPLDQLPDDRAEAAELPPGVQASGPGAPWLRLLLGGVKLAQRPGGALPWVGPKASRDALGVFRIGRPHGRAGLLAHKAELERLELQRSELEGSARQLSEDVSRAQERLRAQSRRVADLEATRRRAEEALGRLRVRSEAAVERSVRGREEIDAAREMVARLEVEREATLERGARADATLAELVPAGATEGPHPEALAEVRGAWEALREQAAEAQLREARAAADHDRAGRDLQARQELLERLVDRHARLGQERAELESELERLQEESEGAAQELQTLFESRETREHESQEREQRAEKMRRKVAELEGSLRRIHQDERSHSEQHHQLELEQTQIAADLQRTRERLEDEWGRPFDVLSGEVEAATGDPGDLRSELSQVSERLAGIGLVNMLAEQEYQEEKERLEFLESQRADLAGARDDLRETIRQINETASAAFLETLGQIRVNFQRTFATLFEGGECDVWLDDPNDPLDSPVEISASPRGKRTQRIHLLSGGERALTALALLFAIYLVKPSPFCVLDEVDAPLDETNILRFVAMLEQFKSDVQFIVITHNPVTIEAADWIYGVTMEEPGVSKIVGVEFSDYSSDAVA